MVNSNQVVNSLGPTFVSQLLAERGIYYKLYQLQYRDQERDTAEADRSASETIAAPPT